MGRDCLSDAHALDRREHRFEDVGLGGRLLNLGPGELPTSASKHPGDDAGVVARGRRGKSRLADQFDLDPNAR